MTYAIYAQAHVKSHTWLTSYNAKNVKKSLHQTSIIKLMAEIIRIWISFYDFIQVNIWHFILLVAKLWFLPRFWQVLPSIRLVDVLALEPIMSRNRRQSQNPLEKWHLMPDRNRRNFHWTYFYDGRNSSDQSQTTCLSKWFQSVFLTLSKDRLLSQTAKINLTFI